MERSQTAPAYAPTEAATPDGQLSVREVARLFNLPESRLRYWAQTGFIRPSGRGSGRSLYSFRDLIGIKVAKELLAAGLSLQRVRKNLDVLRLKLPEVDEPLARLRPGFRRRARIFSISNGLPVIAESPSALRRICPPPSPKLPSIRMRVCVPSSISTFDADDLS